MTATASEPVHPDASVAIGWQPDRDVFTPLDCHPANPCRPLDWRWRIAGHIAGAAGRTRLPWVDEPARRIARHLRESARAGAPAGRKPRPDPAISAALALRLDPDPARRLEVEALVLAGLDDAAIAVRQGLDAGAVAAYVAAFFDARPLLPHTDAILFGAIGAGLYDGKGPAREVAMRLLCLAGGPLVADALVGRPGGVSPAANGGADAAAVRELFEMSVLAQSIRGGGRSALAAIRLAGHAAGSGPAAARPKGTPVTGPVVMADFDVASVLAGAAAVRADGPIAAGTAGPVRPGCAPGGPGPAPGGPPGPGSAAGPAPGAPLREAG